MDTITQKVDNNIVEVVGTLVSNYRYSHEIYGEGFYTVTLQSQRTSGNIDRIECIVSNRLADVSMDPSGTRVRVFGQFRSFNKHDDVVGKNKLILQLFVREIEQVDDTVYDKDDIHLTGFVCKEPCYRKTPLGREVCDVLLAVNRPYGKSDYIPCICWGRNARFAANLELGTKLNIKGRIQSREYYKHDENGNKEETPRIAYEVSACYIAKSKDDLDDEQGV